MATLRVLLASAPGPGRAQPWALVDAQGGVERTGRDPPERWPAASRREAVLAAEAVRVVALPLPPLPPARVADAAAYALEDRLATPVEDSVVVTGAQRADGRVVAVVVGRALAAAIAHAGFGRIVAEPQLAPPPPPEEWRWCATAERGFVLTADGDGFAVAGAQAGALPAELAVALAQAARGGRAPLRVTANAPDAAAQREAWTRATGVPFDPGPPWRWDTVPATATPDLAPALARALAPPPARATRRASFAPGIVLLVAAGALHVVATAATWAWERAALARAQDALVASARSAGVADAAGTAGAAAALSRLHADASHRAGRSVATDAWPLLARAAPALHALPPGALRSARYAAGAWTIDLTGVDDAVLAPFDARLRRAGLSAVTARTPAGVRVRVEGSD